LAEAHRELDRQGMKKTPLRNAILIYLVPTSRQFAIAADEGIHLRCGNDTWNAIAREMTALLKQEHFTEAIVTAVQKCGQALAQHFPKFPSDRDDLPNTVLRD
jgi:putative membrane protein